MTTAMMYVRLDQLHEHPENLRHDYDEKELLGLAVSIATVGIEVPLSLADSEGTDFTIHAGHRRFRALQLIKSGKVPMPEGSPLDFDQIPVYIKTNTNGIGATRTMLVENLQRVDLTPIEEAEGYATLVAQKMTHQDIAHSVGKSKTVVTRRLKLLDLPDRLRDLVHTGRLSLEDADQLTKVDGETAERLVGDEGKVDTWRLGNELRAIDDAKKLAQACARLEKAGYTMATVDDDDGHDWWVTDVPPDGHFWGVATGTITREDGTKEKDQELNFTSVDELVQSFLPGGAELVQATIHGFSVLAPTKIPEGFELDECDFMVINKIPVEGEEAPAGPISTEDAKAKRDAEDRETRAVTRAQRQHETDEYVAVLAKTVPAAAVLEAMLAYCVGRADQNTRSQAAKLLDLEPITAKDKPDWLATFDEGWKAAREVEGTAGLNVQRRFAVAVLLASDMVVGWYSKPYMDELTAALGVTPFNKGAFVKSYRQREKARAAKASAS